jgi:CheY-like chemotaxis protein
MAYLLIADDAITFRDTIVTMLSRAGHEIVTAGTGVEALAACRARRPDLILLDLAMPLMSGMAFLRTIRADPLLKAIPVIVLSGLSSASQVLEVRALGVSGYMLKSAFSLADLRDRVNEALEQLKAANPDAA